MAKFDLKDLKLDELTRDLRSQASKRLDEMVGEGRTQARRAGGGHDDGAVFAAFTIGLLAGALVGAAVALLLTPVSGTAARRTLSDQVDKIRSGADVPDRERTSGNGTLGIR